VRARLHALFLCSLACQVFGLGAHLFLSVRARLHALFHCLLACHVFGLGAHLFLFVRARLDALFHCLLASHVFSLGAHLFLSVRVRLNVAFICMSLVWELIFFLCALGCMLCLFASNFTVPICKASGVVISMALVISELLYIYIPHSCSSTSFAAHLPYITLAPQFRSQASSKAECFPSQWRAIAENRSELRSRTYSYSKPMPPSEKWPCRPAGFVGVKMNILLRKRTISPVRLVFWRIHPTSKRSVSLQLGSIIQSNLSN